MDSLRHREKAQARLQTLSPTMSPAEGEAVGGRGEGKDSAEAEKACQSQKQTGRLPPLRAPKTRALAAAAMAQASSEHQSEKEETIVHDNELAEDAILIGV